MKPLELNILKAIVSDSTKGIEFANSYSEELCESPDAKLFCKDVIKYIKSYREVPTERTLSLFVNDEPRVKGLFDKIREHDYNVKEYNYDILESIKEYQARELEKLKLIKRPDPEAQLKEISLRVQKINAMKHGRSFTQKKASEYFKEFKDHYDAITKEVDGAKVQTIKTGLSALDHVTGGLSEANMVIIGGATNSGKSMLLNTMGINMWRQGNTIDTPLDQITHGHSVMYFSLEMPYEECFAKFLANVASVPYRSILDGKLEKEESKRVEKAGLFIEKMSSLGFEFEIIDFPRGLTVNELELRYRESLLTYRPDAVIIDYLTLMSTGSGSKSDQDWLKMGELAGHVHEFGRVSKTIICTASQLTDIKRSGSGRDKKEDERVGLHRIGRSSHMMHHANVGIQIEDRPRENTYSNFRYHIIKNRKGPQLNGADMTKKFECAALIDVPYIQEEESEDLSEKIADYYNGEQDDQD